MPLLPSYANLEYNPDSIYQASKKIAIKSSENIKNALGEDVETIEALKSSGRLRSDFAKFKNIMATIFDTFTLLEKHTAEEEDDEDDEDDEDYADDDDDEQDDTLSSASSATSGFFNDFNSSSSGSSAPSNDSDGSTVSGLTVPSRAPHYLNSENALYGFKDLNKLIRAATLFFTTNIKKQISSLTNKDISQLKDIQSKVNSMPVIFRGFYNYIRDEVQYGSDLVQVFYSNAADLSNELRLAINQYGVQAPSTMRGGGRNFYGEEISRSNDIPTIYGRYRDIPTKYLL